MNTFHSQFPSYEKQFNAERDEQATEESRMMKLLFTEEFPNVSWDNMKKQNDRTRTNDGCIHYLDTSSGQLYSWNFILSKWNKYVYSNMFA